MWQVAKENGEKCILADQVSALIIHQALIKNY